MTMGRSMITQRQIFDALREVMHPEIKRNLVAVGMIEQTSRTRKSRLDWHCLL